MKIMSGSGFGDISLYDLLSTVEDKQSLFIDYLGYITREKRIPFSAMIELSPICNLDCDMCYIRRTQEEVEAEGYHVMRFEEWKYYIDEISRLGVPNITLTGGECMVHPDFIQIYKYIYSLDIQISIITNCSCLTDEILKTFIECPPSVVSITIYGASEETYEHFCKNGAAYNAVIKNIDRLVDNKIPIKLHCTLGKKNQNDYKGLVEYAERKKIFIHFGGALVKYDKCDDDKLNRAEIDKNTFILSINNKTKQEKFYKDYIFPKIESERSLYGMRCSAGNSYFSINWKGRMIPCISFDTFSVDPRENGGMAKCWEDMKAWAAKVPQLLECQGCIFTKECSHCVAMHYNDTHEFGKPSPRLCFKQRYPEEAAKLQAEYDRRQALRAAEEKADEKPE